MTVNQFNNNTNIPNIKSYSKWVKNKISRIILRKKITTSTIKDNDYDYSIKNRLVNHLLLSSYRNQLDIEISRLEKNCIIFNYLEFELKLYIYPYDYDKTIRNLKFECSKYSIDQKIEEYLILLIDRYWNRIIDFTDNNFDTADYSPVNNRIQNSHEENLK